ncbi:hypothetical protein MUDAN_BIHEEGNE_02714 [Lactiplantibacillus mudanjiangensis]|uniref:Uncharacterized protein n=2 Tax=Lactiplantibacillus mudanjiangensis TaxID=1296538 RepID=A0A660E0E2_9LACO|nr:hypothetical protein MUDAN_BIHEEGNE_02714 [Lactiplantibacillus mudanjiangensis]VDG22985.1 hypothetical protein MUDAN_IGPPGNFN_00519 [Lactiplantibacillus mudanjiangensis]VDG29157.1 hypothetical protein MUDAN_MDHGFNIF_00839 [Lactiplantibacillus mudanjiangensis]VDG31677.1 hypothetical protein MUDAN_DOGOELCO_00967 [Lactiplantibacillus mudanjiangensis]
MLIVAVILLAGIFAFFGITADLMVSAIAFPISLGILMAVMEYAARELRRK